jgi:V8-like Glu-specific endopeptidase
MAVIGFDNRQVLPPSITEYPVSPNSFVVSRYPDGTVATGSGALIGPNDILTAAHVIYSHSHGGYADEVTVLPNAGLQSNGNVSTPFGQYTVRSEDLAVTNGWEDNDPRLSKTPWEFDYGVIELDQSVGRDTGWFAIDPHETPLNSFVESLGYPGDIARPQMVYTSGTIDSVGQGVARFFDDLDSFAGQSGSAVFYTGPDNVPEVMGVISNETFFPQSNGIVRFDEQQKRQIDDFAEANGDGAFFEARKTDTEDFLEPYVDDGWYYEEYPDVAQQGVEADLHFSRFGQHQGRDPNLGFDTDWYLENNTDVKEAGMNPLLHYAKYGWKEGRIPSPEFDAEAYLDIYPDVAEAGIEPLRHYLEHGIFEGRIAPSIDDGFGV